MARKELEPGDVTAIVDTREQLPYNLAPMKMHVEGLDTGDYSVLGLERFVSVERKSLDDFVGCCGSGRERFESECQRLMAYPAKMIIIEASWEDLRKGNWRSQIGIASVTGSAIGWMEKGIPITFAGSRQSAQEITWRFLFMAAKRRWLSLQSFADGLKIES